MGVTGHHSTELQFTLASKILSALPSESRSLLYINISAIHQPNCHYLEHQSDSLDTHAAALRYVDSCLPPLIDTLKSRGTFIIMCSDHGTLYGESGFIGHRVGHEHVFTVPYSHTLLLPHE